MYRRKIKIKKITIPKKRIITCLILVSLFAISYEVPYRELVKDKYVVLYKDLDNSSKEKKMAEMVPDYEILNEDYETRYQIMFDDYKATSSGYAMEVAESLVGLPGSCLYIAQLFVEAYMGEGHSVYNAYPIEGQPRVGDLIYYVNGGAGVEHWAVYLDDNVALQGNFNGYAIISTVYLRNASEPIYYRVP